MNKNINKQGIFWGIIIMLVGIIFAIHYAVTGTFISWKLIWPCAVILIGISSIIQQRTNFFGYILTIVGLFFLLDYFFDFNIGWQFIFPAFIILVGISILISSLSHKKLNSGKNTFVAFSGRKDTVFSDEYDGQNAICLFGGQSVDLRNHPITRDIKFNFTVAFGGVDVFVPTNVNVIVKTNDIFGGVDNYTSNRCDNQFTVFVFGTNLFGGIDIKN